jgi:hypothetical protein
MHIGLDKGDEVWSSLADDKMVDVEEFSNAPQG